MTEAEALYRLTEQMEFLTACAAITTFAILVDVVVRMIRRE